MQYNTFQTVIMERLEHDIPDPKRISIQQVSKNNGIVLDGLTIMENDCNISPTLYLNYYYDSYNHGIRFNDVYQSLLSDYHRHKPSQKIDPSFFTDFDNIRDKIAMKLIHYERNKELLEKVPHIRFLDLAIVFYCLISMDFTTGNATILIHHSHLKNWNITTTELFQIAKDNTQKILPEKLYDMNDVIYELSGRLTHPDPTVSRPSPYPMFVLTNETNLFGATCLLYKDLLKHFSEESQTDFYILPSSIHEVILVPTLENDCYGELSDMVREVNDSQLMDDEILSTHAYYYSRRKNEITM
ncbi:DUF5688 family protein [Eubacterium ramulus]|uniref:DUF5688 family protein n=1 Tax=Eubacterium ramulus TaxID=39490 RepID=UPI0026EDA657|nr:DUF5688 family protein [Eubacterium ramulus]